MRNRQIAGCLTALGVVAQAYETMSSDGTTPIANVPDPNFRFAVNPNGSSNGNTTLP